MECYFTNKMLFYVFYAGLGINISYFLRFLLVHYIANLLSALQVCYSMTDQRSDPRSIIKKTQSTK